MKTAITPSAPFLILAATEFELREIRRAAKAPRPKGQPVATSKGAIGRSPVVLAVCGVGKSSAAFCAGHLLGREEYRAVLNLGCAGAFPGGALSMGDVVIADREVFADEGADAPEGFLDLAKLRLPVLDAPAPIYNLVPIRSPCRLSPHSLARLSGELGFPVRAGPLCTVSTTSASDRRSREVAARWRPMAESMEGAALALAALRHSLPFLEVRGISNYTGDRDPGAWELSRAVSRAAAAMTRLVLTADAWEPPVARGKK
jgi:futalosine hydrolase